MAIHAIDYIEQSKHSRRGRNKSIEPHKIGLQFVPGLVESVVTSKNSPGGPFGPRDINSIQARSHHNIDPNLQFINSKSPRYYPLLRGIIDIPVKGDQVLLCNFGGNLYYLGPINCDNNPNYNHDFLYNTDSHELTHMGLRYPGRTTRDNIGMSNLFERANYKRLQKDFNSDLDGSYSKGGFDLHGDMIFEGRHGNSIRIGSRYDDPYIIISNGRHSLSEVESLVDGTIIGIINVGTIDQHFKRAVDGREIVKDMFTLADVEAQLDKEIKKTSADLISFVNNTNATEIINNYKTNQLFQSSDRITINAKKESLFLSAFQNTHIGSGNSLTISSNKEIILESGNIYIGKLAKKETSEEQTETGQGLVLGEHLRFLLEKMVDILIAANGHCHLSPVPLGYQQGPPGTLNTKLQEIKSALGKGATNFVSSKYFVEDNVS